jgi:hypothetical protein
MTLRAASLRAWRKARSLKASARLRQLIADQSGQHLQAALAAPRGEAEQLGYGAGRLAGLDQLGAGSAGSVGQAVAATGARGGETPPGGCPGTPPDARRPVAAASAHGTVQHWHGLREAGTQAARPRGRG